MINPLCKLDDIPDQGCKEFEVVGRRIIALREGTRVHVYLNLCPHLGVPLNWEPDRFLDEDGVYIRCANHGALFVKESGDCILGPCRGMPLSSVPVIIEDDQVSVKLAPKQAYQPIPPRE